MFFYSLFSFSFRRSVRFLRPPALRVSIMRESILLSALVRPACMCANKNHVLRADGPEIITHNAPTFSASDFKCFCPFSIASSWMTVVGDRGGGAAAVTTSFIPVPYRLLHGVVAFTMFWATAHSAPNLTVYPAVT